VELDDLSGVRAPDDDGVLICGLEDLQDAVIENEETNFSGLDDLL
jgi:hypothetical protein